MQGSLSLLSQIHQDDKDAASLDMFANTAKMFGNQSILLDEILNMQSSLLAQHLEYQVQIQ
jgi:hypothetical protein